MDHVSLGRKLGRGARLAAERLQGQAQAMARQTVMTAQTAQKNAPQYIAQGHAVAAGGKQLGRTFWKRLAHAGRMLWHEVTGTFFALFALFFAQGLWRVRVAWRNGPEHRHFLLYLVLAVLFTYFTVSSFWRSRRAPR
ncbi:MAG: hypothetical protein ACP5EP_11250 [Acidobacteriaceae bacterium]